MDGLAIGQNYIFSSEDSDYNYSGTVVYIDSVNSVCIIRLNIVAESYTEYALYYHEVKNRYPDFEDNGYQESEQRYICFDIESGESLFHYDEDSGVISEAIFDEDDHSFYGYDDYDIDSSSYDSRSYDSPSFGIYEVIDLSMPENELKAMEDNEVLTNIEDSPNISPDGSFFTGCAACNLYRSLSWLVNCDCAIITAWRSSNTRKSNDTNNSLLQQALRSFGYGVSKVRGVYAEVGKNASKENSFLVFDLQHDSNLFYKNVKALSQQFEQDCFLYKRAGRNTLAYLVGTNENFGYEKKVVGRLHIGSMSAKEYSEIGSGRISFE